MSERAGERLGQHLDRDEPIELDFAREVHDAHAAAAELALERVLAGDRFLEVDELSIEHASSYGPKRNGLRVGAAIWRLAGFG